MGGCVGLWWCFLYFEGEYFCLFLVDRLFWFVIFLIGLRIGLVFGEYFWGYCVFESGVGLCLFFVFVEEIVLEFWFFLLDCKGVDWKNVVGFW